MSSDRDETLVLTPKWDAAGLVTAVVQDARTMAVLMVAHMDAQALAATQATGEAHFWSRSRERLWRKGESSGNGLRIVELRIDCDQDAVLLLVEAAGPACHTGRACCFYRRVDGDRLSMIA